MSIESPDMAAYLMTTVMFALSLTIYEIFTIRLICQKYYLGNEGQKGVKLDLLNSTGIFNFILEIFENFNYP